jgi:SAM-dependent methyltransferase
MVGCDISATSLERVAGNYEWALQADLSNGVPLESDSVDAVISSFFWEHVTHQAKVLLLKEIYRVLRPGGQVVFLYDVETRNPLIARYRSASPELYRRLFLEGDGHVGYQSSETNLALFRSSGFQVVSRRGMEKTWLLSPSALGKLAKMGKHSALMTRIIALLERRPFNYLYAAITRTADVWLGPWLPVAWARIDLTVCRKSEASETGKETRGA